MLILSRPDGLYCQKGDFYIDPSRGVDRAVITHAHADHARRGSKHYLSSTASAPLLKRRLGRKISIQSLEYGVSVNIQGVKVSLHPAGHILGSSQVRLEYGGEIWVVSGDYKTCKDTTCTPFEPVACHTFISECTFGLPIFRWPSPEHEWQRILQWWQDNPDTDRTSVLKVYSLGKAQRVLQALKDVGSEILVHPSIMDLVPAYETQGIVFPPMQIADAKSVRKSKGKALVLTPTCNSMEAWMDEPESWQMMEISGWMQVRSPRRKRHLSCGFIVSDHADWDGLNQSIHATGASQVLLTHGDGILLMNWLKRKGLETRILKPDNTKKELGKN